MAKEVIHISEVDAAATSVAKLLEHVRAGAEVVIVNGKRPVAVVRPAEPDVVRLLSESLRIARERGSAATLDDEFGKDLEAVIATYGEPVEPPVWD
jgi:antitoxin (DNA-binding transcriptional repressor) of toxin-antitoxin stability system